jgi:hypothetical protein
MNEHLRELDLDVYRRKLKKRTAEITAALRPHFPAAEHPKVEQFALAAVSIFDTTEPLPPAKLDVRRRKIKQLQTRARDFLKHITSARIRHVHRRQWVQSNTVAEVMGKPMDLDGLALAELNASKRLARARAVVMLAVAEYLSALNAIEALSPPPERTGRRGGDGNNTLAEVAAWWWQFFGVPPTTTDTGPFFAAAAALLRVDNPDKQVRRAVAAVLEIGPPGPPPPSSWLGLDVRQALSDRPTRVPSPPSPSPPTKVR